jgi:hypothetical protein
LNTSRPDNASQREIGSTALSSTRFWRRDSFLRLERCPIRESKVDNRFAVRSNSVRLGGKSTESRSWSWELVRSRTVEEGSSSIIGSSGARVSSSIGMRSYENEENGKVELGCGVLIVRLWEYVKRTTSLGLNGKTLAFAYGKDSIRFIF